MSKIYHCCFIVCMVQVYPAGIEKTGVCTASPYRRGLFKIWWEGLIQYMRGAWEGSQEQKKYLADSYTVAFHLKNVILLLR